MKITAEPRSDQWNADDFVGGPRVFTIAGVKVGSAEQKYDIDLAEGEGRAWRPPLTVLRLLIAAWGDEASAWVGRRVKLYRDESVRFGSDAVGGIRVAELSDLPGGKPLQVSVTVSRGKRAPMVVKPLTEPAAPSEPTAKQVSASTDVDALRAMWGVSSPARRKQIEARVAELTTAGTDDAELVEDNFGRTTTPPEES
ncbi:hypothetical protein [Streptomyces sp.]|uniref:hypothetical protein n=1 Tax=Streptomyces sp. TaxID=1931 RepID=UPI002F922C70